MSNELEFFVYPNISRITKISKCKYHILELTLFTSIRVAVYLYSDADVLIESRQYVISGDEYAAWGTDDTYLVKLLKTKIQADNNN